MDRIDSSLRTLYFSGLKNSLSCSSQPPPGPPTNEIRSLFLLFSKMPRWNFVRLTVKKDDCGWMSSFKLKINEDRQRHSS